VLLTSTGWCICSTHFLFRQHLGKVIFPCSKCTTRDPWLYFPSKTSCATGFYCLILVSNGEHITTAPLSQTCKQRRSFYLILCEIIEILERWNVKGSMECRFMRDTVNIQYAWKVYFYKHTKTYAVIIAMKKRNRNQITVKLQ
jgi:hypothetical protein